MKSELRSPLSNVRDGLPHMVPGPERSGAARHDVIDPAVLLRAFFRSEEEIGLVLRVVPNADHLVFEVFIELNDGASLGPLPFAAEADALTYCQLAADAARKLDPGAVVILQVAGD